MEDIPNKVVNQSGSVVDANRIINGNTFLRPFLLTYLLLRGQPISGRDTQILTAFFFTTLHVLHQMYRCHMALNELQKIN